MHSSISWNLIALTIFVIKLQTASSIDNRLPTTIQPLAYKLSIEVPQKTLESPEENDFMGRVEITFKILKPTNSVSLHMSHTHLNITALSLGIVLTDEDYSVNNDTDILTILSPIDLHVGVVYVLMIDYKGQLSTKDMLGFYKSSYEDNEGHTHYLVATQFQPVQAREAFPCFDEPAYKSIFLIDIILPEGFSAISNSAHEVIVASSGKARYYFKETNLMSTYLVAFIISEFTCTGGNKIGSATYRVCSRDEYKQARNWSVDVGPKLLSRMENYTAIRYDTTKMKLDQVAIPDFAAGAMENWGLVTYRELLLLWDPEESSNKFMQLVTTTISHEFAHFWFGNLVTLNWWSDLFLNEGFATYFEYHNAHEVFPEWQLDKQFVLDVVQTVLLADSLQSTTPLHTNVSLPDEIQNKFGSISYEKGGSIFRMLEHIMGKNNFKNGLRNYIRLRAYNNTTPENLWAAMSSNVDNDLSKLPAKLDVVMHNWINNPGYPLVTVTRKEGTLTLTQEKFVSSDEYNSAMWYIPISYTLSTDEEKFVNTAPQVWLNNKALEIEDINENVKWIILNNQQTGYYRINYDDALWSSIGRALLEDSFAGIDEINRAQIVDDLFNLAKFNKVSYSKVFEIIEFVQRDTSYYTWVPTFAGFDYILQRVGQETILGQKISNHISRLMANLYQSTLFTKLNDTDQIYTLKQMLALSWGCKLGVQDCIQTSKSLFAAYENSKKRPNKNIRSIVYCNTLRNSNDSVEWEFLWNNYISTNIPSEKYILLTSLGCTKNTTLLKLYLNKSITESSVIKPQDRCYVFSSVVTGNPFGYEIALDFLINNHAAIVKSYQSINSLASVMSILANRITDQVHVDKLKNFIQSTQLPNEFKAVANRSLEVAEANLLWRKQFEHQIQEYYTNDKAAGTRITYYICTTFVLLSVVALFVSN